MPHTHNRNTTIRSCALLTILHTICCHPVVVPTSPRYDKPNKGETLWSEAGHLVHKENTHGTDKFEKKANLAKLETLKKNKERKGSPAFDGLNLLHPTPSQRDTPQRTQCHQTFGRRSLRDESWWCSLPLSPLRPLLEKTFANIFFFLHNVESVPLWH